MDGIQKRNTHSSFILLKHKNVVHLVVPSELAHDRIFLLLAKLGYLPSRVYLFQLIFCNAFLDKAHTTELIEEFFSNLAYQFFLPPCCFFAINNMASFLSLIIIPISYYFISFRLQIYDFLPKTPSDFLNIFLSSHRSHRLTQISSLQATVVTMPHSNRYFSAHELRISFGTRIARITRIRYITNTASPLYSK